MGSGYCTDSNAWVRIDLQRSMEIMSGVVTDRSSSANRDFSRMDNFRIWVGNDGTAYNASANSLCYSAATNQHRFAPFKHWFQCVANGRYVFFQPTTIVSSDSNPNADIAEIQIFNVSVFEGLDYRILLVLSKLMVFVAVSPAAYCMNCPSGKYSSANGSVFVLFANSIISSTLNPLLANSLLNILAHAFIVFT
jgi:hypothetical protein